MNFLEPFQNFILGEFFSSSHTFIVEKIDEDKGEWGDLIGRELIFPTEKFFQNHTWDSFTI